MQKLRLKPLVRRRGWGHLVEAGPQGRVLQGPCLRGQRGPSSPDGLHTLWTCTASGASVSVTQLPLSGLCVQQLNYQKQSQ